MKRKQLVKAYAAKLAGHRQSSARVEALLRLMLVELRKEPEDA